MAFKRAQAMWLAAVVAFITACGEIRVAAPHSVRERQAATTAAGALCSDVELGARVAVRQRSQQAVRTELTLGPQDEGQLSCAAQRNPSGAPTWP